MRAANHMERLLLWQEAAPRVERRQAHTELQQASSPVVETYVPTAAEIKAAMSPKGGWTKKQLAAWGVPWPPPKGWRKTLEAGRPVKA